MAEPTGHLQSEQPQLAELRGFVNWLDTRLVSVTSRRKKIDRQKQEVN